MSDSKLAIIVPSRGRPHNLERLAKAAAETCTVDYEILVRLDEDDKHLYPPLEKVRYTVGPRIFFTASVNELAEMALRENFSHVAILGDDVLPETKGWDEMMISSLPELGIVYGSDGLEHLHGADLPTHVVVSIELYKKIGWLALPATRHLFPDNAWKEIGKITGIVYLPHVKLSHLHRWNKAAPDDKTYREANDKKKREDDRIAFENWLNGPGLQETKRLLQG